MEILSNSIIERSSKTSSKSLAKNSLNIAHLKKPRLTIAAALIGLILELLTGLFNPSAAWAAPIPGDTRNNTSPTSGQIINQSASFYRAGLISSNLNTSSYAPAGIPMVRLGSEQIQPPAWSGDWANFGMFSSEILRLNEPFTRLKADWQVVQPEGTRLEIDLRASQDGQNWTLWEVLDENGTTASFDPSRAYLYAQYRVRMFSDTAEATPYFQGIKLEANRRDLNNLSRPGALNMMANADKASDNPPPTYKVYATREGLVGYTTANGHKIQPNDRFVSLPSWTVLNDKGKSDYQVRITAPNGKSAVAPVWDTGPWNFKDNYWHNPRSQFKDIAVGVPQAEKAFFGKHNGGKNESGKPIYNPSGIDIGDGTFWQDLGLKGDFGGQVDVSFIWEGSVPDPATISEAKASDVSSGTASISWKTSQPTSGWVEYGFDTNYGFNSPLDNTMTTSRSVFLQDLVPNKTYNYRVHGKDVYGTETISDNLTFTTASAVVTKLSGWQKDKGVGVNISSKFDAVTIAGGRANNSLWNDNPKFDFISGASTLPDSVSASGGLDLDFAPTCDEKNQNCAYGFGSGYKGYVQFTNKAGDSLSIGIIHDLAISPGDITFMVEGNVGGQAIFRYAPADSLDPTRAYHLHMVWKDGQIYLTFDFNGRSQYAFNAEGLTISFVGAGRAKDDIVAFNFRNIGFSFGAVERHIVTE